MRFLSNAAFGALFAITASNIVQAQDQESAAAQYSSDLQNYVTATLITESAFLAIETNTADVAALMSVQTMNLNTYSPAQLSAVVASLPGEVQTLVTSIIHVASSIAMKDGYTATATASAASTDAAGVASFAITSDSSPTATSSESTSSPSTSTSETSSSASTTSTSGASNGGMDVSVFAGSLMGAVAIVAAL